MAEAGRYPDSLVLELMGILYEVSEDFGHWLEFLERLRRETNSAVTLLRVSNQQTGQGLAPLAMPYDGQQMRAYRELYHPAALELFQLQNPLFVVPGAVTTSQMAVTEVAWERSRLYREFFGPLGWYHLLNATFEVQGDLVFNLVAVRGREEAAFAQPELDLLRALVPHMRRSLQVFRSLKQAAELSQALADSLDYLPLGVVLAEGDGTVFGTNRTAREILDHDASLGLDPRLRLHSHRPAIDRQLAGLIAQAVDSPLRVDEPAGSLVIERPAGAPPLSVLVYPAGGQRNELMESEPCAAIYLSDPERRIEPADSVLRALYGLTAAEARLAALLVRGLSLEQSAARLGVTTNTVRTQLKRVFAKTGTNRQGDLVSLLLSGVEILRVLEPRSA